MHDAPSEQMHERTAARRPKTTDRQAAARCAQCGEALDAQRIRLLAEHKDPVMCRDCAFDAMPCTD
jgi:hypothetical protein